MKKVLLTSTALVAFAGAAAAEVTISGGAEMGIVGGDSGDLGGDIDTQFHQDVDVDFTLTGETDGGLAFGANVDLDEADGLGNEFDNQGVDIFISGAFGTVTMGDTDGALDFVLQDQSIGNPGSLADDETIHAGWFGSYHDGAGAYDGQIVRYDYSFDNFTFAVSFEQAGGGDGDVNTTVPDDIDPGFAIGGSYDAQFGGANVGFGLGYQYVAEDALGAGAEEAEIIGASVDVSTGGFSGVFVVSTGDVLGVEDSTHYALGAGYSFDAFTIHANYGVFDFGNDDTVEGFGLAAGYDLGGGASVLFGYGDSSQDIDGNPIEDLGSTFSLGLSFSF